MENSTVGRHDIEAALWKWSGWMADQRAVDAVLDLVDRYAQAAPAASAPLPCAYEDPEPKVTQTSVQGILERPVQDGSLVYAPQLTAEAYRDPDGVLWLRLGSLPANLAENLERTRKCTRCGNVQPIAWFNRDCKSRNGRKAECKKCESKTRADRRRRKNGTSEEIAA